MADIRIVVVGTKHKGPHAISALEALAQGEHVHLQRETDNLVDPGAVAVYSGRIHIGYLPRAQYGAIRDALDAGKTITATLAAEAIIQNGDIVPGGLPRLAVTIHEEDEVNV